MPAWPDGRHQLLQGSSRRSKDEVVGLLLRIGETATNEQPMASILFPLMQDGNAHPVKEPGAFGPLTHRAELPLLLIKQESLDFADFPLSALPRGGQYSNGSITRYSQHVGIVMRFQPGAQVQVTPIDRISHHPRDGNRSLEDSLHHLNRQFRFGLEAYRLRDACSLTPLMILDPIERKIEFAINEGMPFGRHVGQKDADLTVLDLPGGPAVLHLDARRFLPALGKAAFINGQDGQLLAKLLQDVLAQIITHQISIPDRLGKREAILACNWVSNCAHCTTWDGVVLAPVKVICWGGFMSFSFHLRPLQLVFAPTACHI